jgi:prepilin peptidase dependent protein B
MSPRCRPAISPAPGRLPGRRGGPGRGLSIVELMVGIAISLFIVAGATLVLTTQLGDNRKLLLEAQIQQDMRAAMDMITRDIRNAGYWGHDYRQVWPQATAPANPYRAQTPEHDPAATSLVYSRSTEDEVNREDDDTIDGGGNNPREQVGFKLNSQSHTIDFLVGANNWQALTDAAVVRVTGLTLGVSRQLQALPCGLQCPVRGPGGCELKLAVRNVTVVMEAEAVHDSRVKRVMQSQVRQRNDVPVEDC